MCVPQHTIEFGVLCCGRLCCYCCISVCILFATLCVYFVWVRMRHWHMRHMRDAVTCSLRCTAADAGLRLWRAVMASRSATPPDVGGPKRVKAAMRDEHTHAHC